MKINKLFEMAFNKEKYQNFVYDHYDQIAQNWCLCKYCQLYRKDLLTTTYIHWRSELETQIDFLNKKIVSPDKNKEKWTRQSLISDAELNNSENVFNCCRVKFIHENDPPKKLGITEEEQKTVCDLFSKKIEDIIQCISKKESIINYTRKEFPDPEILKN